MAVLKIAPRASVAVTQLHKINWPVEFRAPALRLDFADARIDLHKGARPQQRVQHQILKADVTVLAVADVQLLDERDGNFAPNLDHARDEIGVVEIKGAVEADGEGNGAFRVIHFESSEMGLRQGRGELVQSESLQIDPVQKQQIGELDAVNGTEAIQFEDAGDGVGVFDLRQPGIGNLKFRIALRFGNFLAEFSNVAGGDAQTCAQVLELLVWKQRGHEQASYRTLGETGRP